MAKTIQRPPETEGPKKRWRGILAVVSGVVVAVVVGLLLLIVEKECILFRVVLEATIKLTGIVPRN